MATKISTLPAQMPAAHPDIQTEWEWTSEKVKCLIASAFCLLGGVAIAICGSIPIGLFVGLLASGIGIGVALTLLCGKSQENPEPPRIELSEETSIAAKHLSRKRNIEIYKETMSYAKEHFISSREYITLDRRVIHAIAPKPALKRWEMPVYVENKSTLQVTQDLVERGLKPLVLDMANANVPGGGVQHGANAQEEILCRQSNLMLGLLAVEERGEFPIPELGGIYFPHTTFFRADPNEEYRFLEEPFEADVYAMAAYCCREGSSDKPDTDELYRANTVTKIQNFLRAALLKKRDSIVASAFGCGAFKNDPVFIATLFKEVLESDEFKGQFKEIAFGIIEDRNSAASNYQIFKEILEDSP